MNFTIQYLSEAVEIIANWIRRLLIEWCRC